MVKVVITMEPSKKIEPTTTTKAMAMDDDDRVAIAPEQKRKARPVVHKEAPLADDDQQEREGKAKKARKSIGGQDSKKKLTEEELRQRNAMYSKRKYNRKKIEVEVQRDQCKHLQTQNEYLRNEGLRLQELCQRAQQCVLDFHQQQQQATSFPRDADGSRGSITALVHHGTSSPQQQLRDQLVQLAFIRQQDHERQQQQLLAEISSLLRQKAAAAEAGRAQHHQDQDRYDQQLLAPVLKAGGAGEAQRQEQLVPSIPSTAGNLKVARGEDQKQQKLLAPAESIQEHQGQKKQENHHELLASLITSQHAPFWNAGLPMASVLQGTILSAPSVLSSLLGAADGQEKRGGSATSNQDQPSGSGAYLGTVPCTFRSPPQQEFPPDFMTCATSATQLVTLMALMRQQQQPR
jgi:hypothetical protein